MLQIRRLALGEAELYRELRLRALRDAPEAFATSLAEALKRSPESWAAQADASAQGRERATFLLLDGNQPVGMAALYRVAESSQTAEGSQVAEGSVNAELLQVWLAPEYRGLGGAERLLKAALDWAQSQGIARVLARMKADNQRAIRFYLRCGFESAGEDLQTQDERLLIYSLPQ